MLKTLWQKRKLQFLILPQCFQKSSAAEVSESVYMWEWLMPNVVTFVLHEFIFITLHCIIALSVFMCKGRADRALDRGRFACSTILICPYNPIVGILLSTHNIGFGWKDIIGKKMHTPLLIWSSGIMKSQVKEM